jgi:hypothetical protein
MDVTSSDLLFSDVLWRLSQHGDLHMGLINWENPSSMEVAAEKMGRPKIQDREQD